MDKPSIEIARLKADIDRKNKLLQDVFEWYRFHRLEGSLGIISRIEQELKSLSP